MNLYVLYQDTNNERDTFDSFVVCAQSEEKAILIVPCRKDLLDWVSSEHVNAQLIGRAAEHIKEGAILCSSYNAG